MNPHIWVASGHVGGFSDPLMDCKECKERFRADQVIENWCHDNGVELDKAVDSMSMDDMKAFIEEHHIGWIALETKEGNQRKTLPVGGKPQATFALTDGDEVVAAYEYCNLHGLWKAEA